jgi:sugar O-acyltransferase (sialic acid O-acetyltransferase NeuD family)
MMTPFSLVLIGFGGHARSVADVALTAGYSRLLFVDEQAKDDESFLEFPVQRSMPLESSDWVYLPCAGDNQKRFVQIRQLIARNLPVATIISPTATIGHGAMVARGCFVGHHAHIGPLARIGAGCIINTGAVVEHDCKVGDCAHVSVHACVAGGSTLGERVFVGAGSVVIDKIDVASDVVVGAGGVVVNSIDSGGIYAGIPARRITDLKS